MTTDVFTRADESPLASPWASVSGMGTLKLASNAVTATTASTDCAMYHSTSSAVDDSQVTIGTVGGADGGPALFDPATGNGYVCAINSTNIAIYKFVGGTFSSTVASAAGSWTTGDTVRLRRVSNTLVVAKNGTDVLTSGAETSYTSLKPAIQNYDGTQTVTAWTDNLSSATADQEGARFGNDDGNEAAYTFAASQDTNLTAPLGTALLIRALINGTGDMASTAYTLRAQKNGTGGYVEVPVGSTVPEVYGTVTFGAIGTGANGSTTVAPSYPSGITAGQYLTCVVTSGATNSETPSTPSGWTLLATGASTDGTYGVDAGPRRVTVFGKEATGSESGTLTVSITNGGTCRGTISRWTKAGSGAWVIEAQGANDSTSGAGVSMTFASMNWNTGDAVLVATGQRVDSATQSAQSLTASGVTFGTRTNRAATAVTTGNDHRHTVDTFNAVSSTSDVDAAPTWDYTASASVSAGGVIVRLREYTAAVTNALYIATSANITAGGEATTARLTAPSGKSTSDFVTGRRWDDENGTDSIDLTTDGYTELEWCVNTQSPAANGDYFDFRVYAGAAALDSYTVTPRWTLGTPSTPSAPPLHDQPNRAARLAALMRSY